MTLASQLDLTDVRVLDGGMATELEKLGCDLSGPLWSAHVLREQPEKIGAVHESYLASGADCILTASYQVSAESYAEIGLTAEDAAESLRASVRLADSPSCIVSDEEEPSLQMQQMLRAMGQKDIPAPKPTLEINPDHEIVKKLLARPDDAVAEDAAWLLFDQALLMEGVPLKDPAAFVQRLNRVLSLSI